ncbi:MAG: hypothetical protein M3N19_02615 [Candidatus Eremiobacteraeota bacterium]|nr:hypothetical protein [Candidatus Eremiobacteraeota bacterium]
MAILALSLPALADQRYSVRGTDRYQIGAHELQTRISYSGKETLSVSRAFGGKHYRVRAQYVRSDQTGSVPAQASFDATLLSSGEQRDNANADPNYLTVLNQPFSVQLDLATLRDLAKLHGRIPFDFPSPMTGGALHGYLMRGQISMVAGRRAIGVDFSADGPMRGPLPDHPAMTLNGSMRMRGTAYYEVDSALLLALDATLTISGNLEDPKKATAVSIIYTRSIRADAAAPALKEASTATTHVHR